VADVLNELWKFGLLLALVAWQGVVLLRENGDKNKKYETATAVAAATGKPLLVVGGPWGFGGWHMVMAMCAWILTHGHLRVVPAE